MRCIPYSAALLSLGVVLLSSCAPDAPAGGSTPPSIGTVALPTLSPTAATIDEACPNRDPADPPWVCRKGSGTPAAAPNDTPTATSLPLSPGTPATRTAAAEPYEPIIPPSLATPTSSSPATCPAPGDAQFALSQLDLSMVLFPTADEVLQPYLAYLNAGGSPSALPEGFRPYDILDLTGDTVSELVLRKWGVFVLGCQDGSYRVTLSLPTDDAMPLEDSPYIPPLIADANGNGLPELVIANSMDNGGGAVFQVFEWRGKVFETILGSDQHLPYQPVADPLGYYNGPSTPAFEDVDDDGRMELVFHVQIPGWTVYVDGLPWREESDIFEWDGHVYLPFETRFAPAEYRFQAVQDGDRATLFGRYDEALTAYQLAIFGDKVTWWSPERRAYLQEQWDANMAGILPESPAPYPDPDEYPYLAAYSRFRIMLLHVIRGWTIEANTVYETLLDKYPSGSSGGIYSDMAKAFMDRFSAGGSIAESCHDAIEVASSGGSRPLYYLGAQHHGWQSHQYSSADMCPFGSIVPSP